MGQIYSLLISFCLLSCGYGGDKENVTENKTEPTATTSEGSAVYLEADEWRGWSPLKEVSGYSLVQFVTDPFKLQGLYSTTARYEKGEFFITVQIIDGTTEKGKAEIQDHLEIAELERDYSSEYGYEKTVQHNSIKAKEEYLSPPAGQYLIKFMLRDRYGVSVKSNAESAATVWDFIDRADFNVLK